MIPFNAPPVVGTELDYMQSAMGSGKLCGDGGFTRRCQQWLEQRFGSAKVLLTPSCTASLEMAALLLLAALARTLYLPQPENGRTLHAAALAAFCLCLCWELPRVLLLLAASLGSGAAAVLPELLSGLALCCIGGMGLACTGQGKTGND